MTDSQQLVPYNERDYAIMVNNVFIQLCQLDVEDRRSNTEPQWQNIKDLADRLRAYDNRVDVAYLAEETLLDERGFIERDMHSINVRLTPLGRENCGTGIDIAHS